MEDLDYSKHEHVVKVILRYVRMCWKDKDLDYCHIGFTSAEYYWVQLTVRCWNTNRFARLPSHIRKNVTIQNLVITDYFTGIYCRPGAGTTTNITLRGNYIHNCNIGIEFLGTSNNLIKFNTFKNNSIDISVAYVLGDNLITQNSIDSYIQVWMSDPQTIDMNYWTDYNGTDKNGDGIGDTPYYYQDILQDNHPLIEPVPIIPEFPSWTILPLLVVATLVGVIIGNKIRKKGLE